MASSALISALVFAGACGASVARSGVAPGPSVARKLRGGMTMSASSTYRLTYFDARGAGELSRVLLTLGKQEYEDKRYPIAFVDGKPSVPDFQKAKEAGDLKANMGRVPILDVDGVEIGQSKAIERFLARKLGMYGSSDLEAAQVDAVCEHCRDVKEAFGRAVPPFAPEDEEKEKKRDEWYATGLPSWFSRLEDALPASEGDWLVGSSLTLADVYVWSLVRDTFPDKERCSKAMEGCTRLRSVADRVALIPELSAWLESRPVTNF